MLHIDEKKVSFPVEVFRDIFFLLLLISTLLPHDFLWISRISWVLLSVYFAKKIKFGLYAIFFYSAFFSSSGFGKELFFTLKHFHIAFFITLMTHLIIHEHFRKSLMEKLRQKMSFFLPLILMLAISIIPIGKEWPSKSTWLILANLFLVSISFYYVSSIIPIADVELSRLILFFLIGTCLHLTHGIFYDFMHPGTLSPRIRHNNHLAVAVSSCIPFSLSLCILAHATFKKILYCSITILLFAGLLLTCSRTSWIATVIVYLTFFYLTFRHPIQGMNLLSMKRVLIVLFSIFGIICLFAMKSDLIHERLKQIPQLWSPHYWNYALSDQQNFGFFGIFRLRQIYELWEILKTNPLLGRGFTRDILGFHGLYFCVLGGSGLVGLALMALFFKNIFHILYRLLHSAPDHVSFYSVLGTFGAILTWALCSFMETLILQFSVWIPIVCTIHLSIRQNESK